MNIPFVPLYEVCELLSGFAWSSSKFKQTGHGLPIIRIQNVDAVGNNNFVFWDDLYEDQFLIKSGDILLTLSGSFRITQWNGPTALLNQRIVKLTPSSKIWPKWLLYTVSAQLEHIEHLGKHALVNNVSLSDIRALKIPLPPFSEQRRIADILDKADALRAKRRTAIAQLELLINSIFKTCFHDALNNPKRFRLVDLVEEFRYGTSEKSCDQGFPTLRIPNVIGNSVDLNDLKTVQVDSTEFKRLQLMTGDLLFVRTNGNPDNVGRCAVFDSESVAKSGLDPNKFIYASYLIRARLKKNGLIPEVLQHYLACDDGRHALRSYCKTSAGQYNINTEGLGSIPIPHFSLNLQQIFLNQINAILKLKSAHRASLAELDALFASLQHRAFRGEL